MGVRSAIADSLTRAAKAVAAPAGSWTSTMTPVAKTFGGTVPESFAQGEEAAGMTPSTPFSPGTPIGPYDGYDRTPRSRDFVTGYNIATRPRTHERVSFEALTGLIEAYDVASICIWHRIDSIRSLDWKLVAEDGYAGDVSDAIAVGMEALKKPDRQNSFETWLAKWLYDVLAYDAGTLSRMRNRAGRTVGLQVIDGRTIAPLLDDWGNSPESPAEAYVQYANGLPFNWLTREDLIYEPFRPVASSPYGRAPIESIILNANTDLRFQLYFLQRFTQGNIPEAFASAPETWSPDQIEAWQTLWDSLMYGDQSRKSQIHWMPGGSTITWSSEKDFTDAFSLFLMRKSCASFHIVPTDIGFTENSNYSTGESQADVGHRIGDLPLGRYVQRIITSFLHDDLGLPLKHMFDWGEEQDDRLAQAQADEVYVQNAVVSASELRQMRFGLEEPAGQVVPRIFFTSRSGPIPLSALYSVAGATDPESGAPEPGVPLPETAFTEIQGVLTNPPLTGMPLAEQEHGPSALPPMPPQQPMPPPAAEVPVTIAPQDPSKRKLPGEPRRDHDRDHPPVAKEATAGITSATGVYGYDGPGSHDDDDDDGEQAEVAKAEMAAFRRFERSRRKAGAWRDFQFSAVSAAVAGRLNAEGRSAVDVAKAIEKSKADEVFHQLTEDYPKASLEWVHHAAWEGPTIIPFSKLDMSDRDEWRASHEPDRVADFAAKIRKRLKHGKDQLKKPAVVVFEPGARKALIVDGHHRTLGAEKAGQDGVLAWAGHTGSKNGPWLELHDLQFSRPAGSAPGSGDDVASDQVGKAAVLAAWLLLRAPNADGKWRYLLQKRDEETSHGGTWGLPGGKAAPGEDPWDAAVREAAEELGALPEQLTPTAGWASGAARIYLADVPGIFRPDLGGESSHETAGWGWFRRADVEDLPQHPALRRAWEQFDFAEPVLGGDPVVKAGEGGEPGGPKAPPVPVWPGWALNRETETYWAPLLTAAVTAALPDRTLRRLAAAFLAANPPLPEGQPTRKRARNDAAYTWLTGQGVDFTAAVADIAAGVMTDGYLTGAVSAAAVLTGGDADTGGWEPGDSHAAAARVDALGAGVQLAAYQGGAQNTAAAMGGAYQAALARALTGAQDTAVDTTAAAAALAAVLADGKLAANTVLDVALDGSATAAQDRYQASGAGLVDVVNGPDPCGFCAGLAASNPNVPGVVPAHPHCECAEIPHR